MRGRGIKAMKAKNAMTANTLMRIDAEQMKTMCFVSICSAEKL